MVRKTKDEANETREKILDAAADIFYEQGVSKSTLEDIAEAAGVTRGAVYWHFKNKLDLFSALHSRLHTSFVAMLSEDLKAEHADPLQLLEDIFTARLQEIQSDAKKRKLFSIFILKCDYSGDLAEFLQEQNTAKNEIMGCLREFYTRAIARGKISSSYSADILTLSCFSYICGLCTESIRNPKVYDMSVYARPLLQRFFCPIKT